MPGAPDGPGCRSRGRHQSQPTLDQPSPAPVLVTGLDRHAIERERGLQEPSHALGDALLGDLDAVRFSMCSRVHDRHLRRREIGSAVLKAAKRWSYASSISVGVKNVPGEQ